MDISLSVRTTCDDPTSEIACVDDATGSGTEVLVLSVTQGTSYFVMIEGVSPLDYGWYELDFEEQYPEMDCWNLMDDDADGYLDCDDPTSCKGSFDCASGPGVTGVACFDPTDCASPDDDPMCLQPSMGYVDGYCSQFCNMAAPDCAGDSVCVDLGLSVHGLCLDGCVTSAECRPGYMCVDIGAASKVCTTAPELNCYDHLDGDYDGLLDCEDPTSCKGSASCTPGTTAVGEPCQIQTECQASAGDPYCIDQPYEGWPGGYCSEFCSPGDPCPPGTTCAYDVLYLQSGGGVCLKACLQPNDCRPGYSCWNSMSGLVCVY